MSTSRTSPSFSRADLRSVTIAQDLYDTLVTGRRNATVRGAPCAAAPIEAADVAQRPAQASSPQQEAPAHGILKRAKGRPAAGQALAVASLAVAAVSGSDHDTFTEVSRSVAELTVMSSEEARRAFADFAPASAPSRPRLSQPWAEPLEIGRREPAITPAHDVLPVSGFGSAQDRNAVRSLAASLRGTST